MQVYIHGPVSLSENVDCIVANSRHRNEPRIVQLLNKFVKKNQCKLVWRDQLPALSAAGVLFPSILGSHPHPSSPPIPTPFSQPQQGQGIATPAQASPSQPLHHKTIPVPRPPIPAPVSQPGPLRSKTIPAPRSPVRFPVSQSRPLGCKTTPVSCQSVPSPVSRRRPLHSKTSPSPRPTIPVQQRRRFRRKTSPTPRFPSAATYDTDSSCSSNDNDF